MTRTPRNQSGTLAPKPTFSPLSPVQRYASWRPLALCSLLVRPQGVSLLHWLQNETHILWHYFQSFMQSGIIHLASLASLPPDPAAYDSVPFPDLHPKRFPKSLSSGYYSLVSLKCPAPSSLPAQSCSSWKIQAKWYLMKFWLHHQLRLSALSCGFPQDLLHNCYHIL